MALQSSVSVMKDASLMKDVGNGRCYVVSGETDVQLLHQIQERR